MAPEPLFDPDIPVGGFRKDAGGKEDHCERSFPKRLFSSIFPEHPHRHQGRYGEADATGPDRDDVCAEDGDGAQRQSREVGKGNDEEDDAGDFDLERLHRNLLW